MKTLSNRHSGIGSIVLSGLVAFIGSAVLWFSPASAQADDLAALQTSVISTDLFLSWIPLQKEDLGLTLEQVSSLRTIQGDFKARSEAIGRRIQKNAGVLSAEVSRYPIDLKKIKPSIDEISELRGELTYSAIKSLFLVQTTLKQSQWDKAKGEWAHILASQTVAPASSPARPPKKTP